MANALPAYNLADLHGSQIDQLGQFEAVVNEAERSGVATRLPANEQESNDTSAQHVRIHTIATRLYLLGYLSRRIPRKRLPSRIEKVREAVGLFQKDADLLVDHWVGERTWHALDELVSFESKLTPEKWFADGHIRTEVEPALQRAARLRLWSLGLCNAKPKTRLIALGQKTLRNFEAVARAFRMKPPSFAASFDQPTLELLFDQDALIQTVATRADPERKTWLLDLRKDKQRRSSTARHFVLNCAKVELWLLGYDVKIDGSNDYSITISNDLYQALASYYQHFDQLSQSHASELAKTITPQLFVGLAEASMQADTIDEDDASAIVTQQIASESQIEAAWTYVQTRSLSLWDGLKRVWRWIKKRGKQVLSFIQNNLFRGFFRFANKAYKIVTRGLTAVTRSIRIHLSGKLATPGVTYAFSSDLDTLTLVSAKAPPEQILTSLRLWKRQTKAFSVACRIIALVFDVFKNRILSLLGWAKFLFTLVSSYQDIKRLYLDFKALAVSP